VKIHAVTLLVDKIVQVFASLEELFGIGFNDFIGNSVIYYCLDALVAVKLHDFINTNASLLDIDLVHDVEDGCDSTRL
jgi:hypothetical protein